MDPILERYQALEDKIKAYNPSLDTKRLYDAFNFADNAHSGQLRKDGTPYITHPLAVAEIVAELELDVDSIIAALLHDTIEDTGATHEEIAKRFGPAVADLVEGVTKLTRVQYTSKEEEQMENLRKMLMAMAKDIRVILIKICDRLHNMRTMEYQTPRKQKEKALETMEIYAPIAHRLGMQRIKWELEDTSLRYLDPVGYKEISDELSARAAAHEEFMASVQKSIEDRLEAEGIRCTIYGRVKHAYSIYRKMYAQNKTMDEIFDLYAFRVIVDDIPACYNVLGVIHDMFKPVLGRFKDYIGTPKPNGYQSLHTTVFGREGIPFEVQIRTWDMHHTAEYGIAAHWKYKQGMANAKLGTEAAFEWVRKLLESQQDVDAEEFVRTMRVDLFSDEVFVFTPKGDVVNLPLGSTVIDFAYAIHSAVGNRMIGAKVDKRIVPLDYKVKTGEIIEILTTKEAGKGPNRDWLTLVRTSEARNKIRAWFKKEKRDENIIEGKAELEREFRRSNMAMVPGLMDYMLESVGKRHNCSSEDDFYAAIGYGGIQLWKVMPRIREEYQRLTKGAEPQELPPTAPPPEHRTKAASGVLVEGMDNCLVKLSRCCNPLPGDEIIGFITRGFGVSIHKRDCTNVPRDLTQCPEPDRWVKAHWEGDVKDDFKSTLHIVAVDRPGLLADVTLQLSAMKINIHALNSRQERNSQNAFISATISIKGLPQLQNIIERLSKINGVISIDRT